MFSLRYYNILTRPKYCHEPFHVKKSVGSFEHTTTVNSEIFGRILFLRIALKDIFATFKNRDQGVVYIYQ